ncbi:MAG: serine hydrolase [Methylovirgula sp.]
MDGSPLSLTPHSGPAFRSASLWTNLSTFFGESLHKTILIAAMGAMCCSFVVPASATPSLVVDVATGDVLYAEQATEPWYPASLTKLMTFYVAMSAVRDHKISLDTPLVVSARAAAAPPSKMGFKPGTQVTLGNALKMMVVKSANDLAIVIAEGVAGSVEAFAEDMNATAAQLGMRESHFVTPNGLHDPEHVSSARDLAILARAIYQNYPQEAQIFGIGALRLGDEIVPTHNTLLGRYPGVDGMKTGFTCAAGFNIIVTAQRGGHRYLAVVMGAPTVPLRMLKTAVLLDRAFDGIDHPEGKLDSLGGGGPAAAPDMHNQICRARGKAIAAYQAEIAPLEAPLLTAGPHVPPAPPPLGLGVFAPVTTAEMTPVAPSIALMPQPVFDPVSVYLGPAPGYQGPVAQARPAHSPVGTEPPPEAASAYAEPKETPEASPLKPDPGALPLKTAHHGHKAKVAAKTHHHKVAKVDTDEKPAAGDEGPKPKSKHHHAAKSTHVAKTAHPAKTAHAATVVKKHVAASPATKVAAPATQ